MSPPPSRTVRGASASPPSSTAIRDAAGITFVTPSAVQPPTDTSLATLREQGLHGTTGLASDAAAVLTRDLRHTHSSLLGTVHRSWLLNAYGEKIPISSLRGKVVGIYFSAPWSLPCRAFTAALATVYMQLKSQPQKPFEIVWASFEANLPPSAAAANGQPSTPASASRHAPSSAAALGAAVPTIQMDFGLHIPVEDRVTRRRLVKLFTLRRLPALVFLDGSGNILTTRGVPLVTQRGADGYPFAADGVRDLEARRRFEQEVVEIFAHVDRHQRLQIDAADLEACLQAGGQLPPAAIRACASSMLGDIGSASLHDPTSSSANGPASSSSGAQHHRSPTHAHAPNSISLAEWKAYFLRTVSAHGAEYPLSGLRQMLALPEHLVTQVAGSPDGRGTVQHTPIIPAMYRALEAEARGKEERRAEQERLERELKANQATHERTPSSFRSSEQMRVRSLLAAAASSSSSASSPAVAEEEEGDAIPLSPNHSPRKR